MDISFFIIGGIIFATYIALTFWNIFYSNKKQREENYPNLKKDLQSTIPSVEEEKKSDL